MTAQPQPDRTPAEPPERHASAGRIFSILGQFAVMQVVLAVTGMVRNKVVALRLGPAAFGEIAQIGLVTTALGTVVAFGMGVSLKRNSARARTTEERRAQLATANAIVLTLAVLAVVACAGLLAGGRFLALTGLAQTRAAAIASCIFLAALPLDALKNNYLAILQGVLDVKALAVRRGLAVLLATAAAIPIVWVFGYVGAAVQYLLLSAFVAVLLGWRCHQLGFGPLQVRAQRDLVAQLASFGLVSLASGAAQSLADTAVRSQLIHAAGAAANGLLQAPYALAQTVNAVVLTSVGSIALATVAGHREPEAASRSIDELLNVVVPVATSALGLLGLCGSWALQILYSSSFTGGAALFPFMLVGDLLMVFAWVVGAPLLAFGDRVIWLAFDLVYALVRFTVAAALVARYGALAVVIGYACAVALHVALNLAVFHFRYGLRLRAVHALRVAGGVALVCALAVAGSRPAPLPVLAACAGAWLAYSAYFAHRTRLLDTLMRRLGRA